MSHKKHRKPQFTVNSTLTIPDGNPGVEFLLRVTSTPVIEQCAVSKKQIHFTGYINIFAEYVAAVRAETQPVSFAFFKLPFDQIFAYSHARTGMNACLKCDIAADGSPRLASSRDIALALNVKISGVKLARANSYLPPHHCQAFLINFFEMNKPEIYIPPAYRPEQGTDSSERLDV